MTTIYFVVANLLSITAEERTRIGNIRGDEPYPVNIIEILPEQIESTKKILEPGDEIIHNKLYIRRMLDAETNDEEL